MKHTKGPWTKYLVNFEDCKELLESKKVYSFGDLSTGTLVGITLSDNDRSKNNADLIAAAPEMFEVLIMVAKYLDDQDDKTLVDLVDTAIQKAKGL